MLSNKSYNALKKAGLSLDKGAGERYNNHETLASKEDLQHLFDFLKSAKEKHIVVLF
jgi:hypothetical protein